MGPREHYGVEGRLAQAVSHPIRVDFLRLLADRKRLTPREALRELAEDFALSQVSYHVSVLEHVGAVEAVGPSSGGLVFEATDTGELLMLAIGSRAEGGSA